MVARGRNCCGARLLTGYVTSPFTGTLSTTTLSLGELSRVVYCITLNSCPLNGHPPSIYIYMCVTGMAESRQSKAKKWQTCGCRRWPKGWWSKASPRGHRPKSPSHRRQHRRRTMTTTLARPMRVREAHHPRCVSFQLFFLLLFSIIYCISHYSGHFFPEIRVLVLSYCMYTHVSRMFGANA